MDYGLAGKVVLVSAGSKGIGLACARLFAEEGADVAICGRTQESLDTASAALEKYGGRVFAQTCDVSNKQDLQNFYTAVVEELGAPDILVNNAGGPKTGGFDAVADDDWQDAFLLTLMSAVNLTNLALPAMRQAGWGRIINISSYSIKQPIPQILLSNVMRLGVQGWAKSLATEIARDGVTVNTVCPGWTKTDRVQSMFEGNALEDAIVAEIPMQRIGSPEEIAAAVLFFASQHAGYITGTALQVDGGIVRASL